MVSISHEHMIYFNATKAEITSQTNFVNYVLYNRTALIYTAYRDINNYQSYQPTALVSQDEINKFPKPLVHSALISTVF